MASVTKSWRQIEIVLQENALSTFRALGKPASEAQLRRLEKTLGAKLPRDFIESLSVHDGLQNSYLGQNRLFDNWALLPTSAILTVWKEMTDLQAECGFGGCQLKVARRIKNDTHWRAGWTPLLDADGDKLVMDLDPGPGGKIGQMIIWSNSGNFPTRVLADSWGEWLAGIAGEFAEGQFQIKESGGIWLNRRA